jgi:cyclophilin family peptidyl-prolyl cis-trans isomerase/HEAT repeat protein
MFQIRGPQGPRYVLPFLLLIAGPALAQPALRERMLIAEDQRAPSDADLAVLRQGLSSRDPATRRQAVRAIGRLERPDLIPLISRLLTDPNNEVRIETVNAVGQLARGAEAVAAAKSRLLARAKGEKAPRVRGVVAATLGRLPYTTAADVQEAERAIAPLVPMMVTVANLDEVAGAVEGLEALIRQSGKIAPPSADTIARLKAVSTIEGRPEDRELLTRIRRLARLALNAAGGATLDLLTSGMADSDDEVRRLTMIAARANIEKREGILKLGLIDREPRVRYEALQTWVRAFPQQSCGPAMGAVRDENAHVMLLAIDLLPNACPPGDRQAATTLAALAQTLSASRTWHAPAHALVALAAVDAKEAEKLLPLYAAHPVWQVRMYAARAAGTLKAADNLGRFGRDANDNVRDAALAALVANASPEVTAVALEALTRPDYQLVIAAARALAKATDKARVSAALLAALARVTAEKRDTSRDPRMAILNSLEAIGGDFNAALAPYARDFDPAIARKAAEMVKTTAQPQPLAVAAIRVSDIDALRNGVLRFAIAGKGSFSLRLLVDEAPASALRVAARARAGYYNGLTFHRVVPNFVIQGGSPGANEYMGDGAYMRDEVGLVSHRRGTVGISTRGRDTGDAQIFINLVDLPRLDHTYTVFAEVVSGMDIVDRVLEGDVIERVEWVVGENSR